MPCGPNDNSLPLPDELVAVVWELTCVVGQTSFYKNKNKNNKIF